jgi:hypothetical protein
MSVYASNKRSSEIGEKQIKCELKQRIVERTQWNKVECGVSRSMYTDKVWECRGMQSESN